MLGFVPLTVGSSSSRCLFAAHRDLTRGDAHSLECMKDGNIARG